MDRSALIAGLAESVGITENIDLNYTGTKYNRDTGTYYCDGIPLPHGSMEQVKDWYKSQMEVYRDRAKEGGTKREYFIRYAVAYNAITMMMHKLQEDGHEMM